MLHFVLSLGAIYAFIPVIIIIILLLAARGSIGGDFFEIFGISSIVTGASGIGNRRGLLSSGKYRTNTKRTDAAAGAAAAVVTGRKERTKWPTWTGLIPGQVGWDKKKKEFTGNVKDNKGQFGFNRPATIGGEKFSNFFKGTWALADADSKENILKSFTSEDTHNMIKELGNEKVKRAEKNVSGNDLAMLAVYGLSLKQINGYYKKNIEQRKKPGTTNPLAAPTEEGKVHMSVTDFYSTWAKARVGGMGGGMKGRINARAQAAELHDMTSGWSSEQLGALLRTKSGNYSPNMSRDQMNQQLFRNFKKKDVQKFMDQHEELFKEEEHPA